MKMKKKLKNFNWNEQAIDQIQNDDSRYTTYTGYGTHDYNLETKTRKETPAKGEVKREELSAL